MTGLWAGGGAYQAWTEFLGRWAGGEDVDAAAPPRIAPEDLPGDAWERLVARIGVALDRRLQTWADALTTALSAAPDEFSAGRALTQARVGLRPIRALVTHPNLPDDIRTRLTEMVDDQTRRLQQDLEREVEQLAAHGEDPRWVEARRRTLRDNQLTAILTENPTVPAAPAWSFPPVGRRRRVITD